MGGSVKPEGWPSPEVSLPPLTCLTIGNSSREATQLDLVSLPFCYAPASFLCSVMSLPIPYTHGLVTLLVCLLPDVLF